MLKLPSPALATLAPLGPINQATTASPSRPPPPTQSKPSSRNRAATVPPDITRLETTANNTEADLTGKPSPGRREIAVRVDGGDLATTA